MSLYYSLGKEDLFDILSDLLNIPCLEVGLGKCFFSSVEGQDMLYQSLKLTNGIWVLAELKIQPPNPNFVVIIFCCAVCHSEKNVCVFVIFFLVRKL
jgi:hypothetical protein